MAALLLEAQKSLAHHAKTSKALFEIEKKDPKTFGTHFVAAVDRALVVSGREPAVERFIKFIVLYASAPGRSVLERLLRHLSSVSRSEEKTVRFRCCQIISSLLCKLAENNAQLDAELADSVKNTLLVRSKDKYAAVRAEAAAGLSIFQDAKVADEVFDHYVRLLDDQQKEVRSAALSNISLSRLTLTEVMKRTRDADESIRQETYRILAQKIPFQKLSVEQRVDVVRSGLSDSSDRVRAACVEMIKSAWLPVCKGDIPTLLGFMDVEDYEECAEILLRTLLQDASDIQPFGNKKTITVQEALFWRMFAEQIKTRPAESRIDLEELLPGMEAMKTLLNANRRNEFVCRQLLLTCAQFDPGADELGCRELCTFLESWVYSVQLSEDMRVITCRALSALHDADSYKRFMLTAIRDFSSESIDTVTETSATSSTPGWAQCITLVEEWFTSSKELPALLVQDIVRNILLPLIPLHDATIRNRGMKCLGLACTLSEQAAKQFGEVFVQAIQNDIASVRQTAMKALFDLIMVWGTKIVAKCSSDPLSYLATCLGPTTPDALKRIAVEGFVKLLVSDTVRDEKILAQLFVLHFELRDERPSVMKRCLQTFFESYARWSHRNQSIITKAYVSTIHSILRAAPSSALKKVKPIDVTQFISALTNPALVEKKKRSPMKITSYHNQLALAIATEVHTSQRLPEVEDMLKVLPTLQLNKQDIAPLLALAGIVKSLQNRTLADPVKKALAKLVALMKDLGVELPAEATPEPTNPRPVDKGKRTLNLARVVPEADQEHFASLDAFDLEEEKPAAKRAARTPGQKLCGNCQSALAAWFCQQCTAFWCNTCLQSEHKAKVFQKHTVTAFSSSPQRSGAATTTPKKVTIAENNSPELVIGKPLVTSPAPSKARPQPALATPEPKKARLELAKAPDSAPARSSAPVSATKAPQPSAADKQRTPSAAKAPPIPTPTKPTPASAGKRAHADVFELNFSDEEQPPAPQTRRAAPAETPPDSPPPVQSSSKRGRSAPKAAEEAKTSDTAPQSVKVAFSGFSDQAAMGELCKKVEALGGMARLDEAGVRLSLKGTHVIVDNLAFRTLKTVIAAVCGMWIVTPQWVHDSAAAGRFLHEGKYGKMYCTKPHVAGKRFFLSAGFRRDPRFNSSDWHTLLVRVGEGKIVDSAASADYILVANGEKVPNASDGALLLTWPAAMEMLQPSS